MSMLDCVVKYVNGHIECFRKSDNGFLQSADNEQELEHDIENYVEQKVGTVA